MSNIINMLVTIDTDRVIKNYPKPSKDQNLPTGLSHDLQYMVVSDNRAIKGQGGADLEFSAEVGDLVRMHGTSEYANFEKSILIYKIKKFGGEDVFGEFRSRTFTKGTPAPSGPEVLPAKIIDMDFWFFEADVLKRGTEDYQVWIALYVKGELYGYFYWDPRITVKY